MFCDIADFCKCFVPVYPRMLRAKDIGAIGASGATAEQDEQCAQAGAAAL